LGLFDVGKSSETKTNNK